MTPYERLLQQQLTCNEDIIGYAVAVATERTRRAAYLTGTNYLTLTNDEKAAAILPKEEAARLMVHLYDSGSWYDRALWSFAFLVPVSVVHPLTSCTFNGW